MNLILALGVLTFFVSTIYFLLKPKPELNTPFIVSFVTLISYLIMLEGNFLVGSPETGIYWTRWIGYALSCPLLMYTIAKKLNYNINQIIINMFLTAMVMLTGAWAGLSTSEYKWMFFGLSTFAFSLLIAPILKSESKNRSQILPYIIIGWCGFPLIFLLSYESFELIKNNLTLPIYLGLDIFTKIVFYAHQSKLTKTKD